MKNSSIRRLGAVLLALVLCLPLVASCAPGTPGAGGGTDVAGKGENTTVPVLHTHTAAAAGIPAALRSLTVSNATEVGGIIGTDSAFTVTTAEATDAETLARYLTVTPSADWEITGEGTEFTMRPRTALEANTVYRFRIADPEETAPSLLSPAAFVFQTEDVPRVASVFPADRATDVPVNTGIEFTFSERLSDKADLARFVTLEPAVSFRVELYAHGLTFAVIPTEPLPEGETVTATLAPGVPLASGRTVTVGASTTFRTAYTVPEKSFTFSYSLRELTVRPEEQATLGYSVYYSGEAAKDAEVRSSVDVTVYRYADAAAAAAALLDYEKRAGDDAVPGREVVFPVEGLKKVGTYTLDAECVFSQYWNNSGNIRCSFTLPSLGAGCYLIVYDAEGALGKEEFSFAGRQAIVQVTDISVSTVAAGDDLVVWLQRDGQPCAGASVDASLYSRVVGWNLTAPAEGEEEIVSVSAAADGNGLVRLGTGGRNAALLVVKTGDDSRCVCVQNSAKDNVRRRVYLYTDREEYFPTDRISFWGVVTPAAGLDSLTYSSNAADGGRVSVSEDGTFSGSLSYADYVGYGVSLTFTDADGNALLSAYKTISREEKPVYTASLSFDKNYYRRGETVTATLRATFFDGTPAGGMRFLYNAYGFGSGEVTTDEDGCAVIALHETSLDPRSTDPVRGWVYCELIGDEISSLYVNGSFLYFHSDRILETERTADGIRMTLYALDTTALDDPETWEEYSRNTYSFDRALLRGAPEEGTVSYTLRRYWTERVSTGTYYDPVEKVTRETFEYREHEEYLEKDGSKRFVNGELLLPYVTDPIEGSRYQYEIWFCENGRSYPYYQSAVRYEYEQTPDDDAPTFSLYVLREDGTGSASYGRGSFVPGEAARFTVLYGDKPYTEGKVLFVTASPDGIVGTAVSADASAEIAFDGALVPNGRLVALVSDGVTDPAAFTYDLTYDYEKLNQLTVTLTPSAEKALPGETVDTAVEVRLPDGTPLAGAEVVLSVVDEADFALRQQTLEPSTPLSALIAFRSVNTSVNGRYSVLDDVRFYGDGIRNGSKSGGMYMDGAQMEAEMPTAVANDTGMGGGDEGGSDVYVRETFLDNPVFVTVHTDADGRASAAIRLPDNITTWRISAVAAARGNAASPVDVLMGASKDAVVVTLPFFVTTTVGSVYLTGDDIALSAKVSGVGDFADAAFTAQLVAADGTVVREAAGSAKKFAAAYLNLGKAEAGEYTVRVTARSGDYADAVAQTFTVVDSAILLRVNKVIGALETASLSPSLYPVALTFFDDSHPLVQRAVGQLLTGRSGRTDAKAAYLAALLVCGKLYGASALYADEIASLLAELEQSGGAWGIFQYAEPDPAVTAKICLLLADQLSYTVKKTAEEYLRGVVSSAQDAQSAASGLLGLAALGCPILGDLHYAAQHWDEMNKPTPAARLTLAAAFAAMGDGASARAQYDAVAAEYRVTQNGETYFTDGGTSEDALALTNAALLAASLISPEEAAALMEYCSARTSAYELYALEKAIFACAYAPDTYTPKTLTYRLGGEEKTVEIDGRHPLTLTLNRDSFASFAVTAAEEGIAVRAMYWGTPAESASLKAENMTVKKTIEASDPARGFYRVTVTVSGETDRESFFASLTDRIPTGARFVRLESSSFSGSDRYVYGWIGEDGGQMLGSIYVSNPTRPSTAGRTVRQFTGTFTYVIRAYTPGEFVVEAAYVTDGALNTCAVSERSTVRFVK